MSPWTPERGDFIVVSFDPQSGREQKGRRPALVVSHTRFNQRTGLAVVCPVTNTDRGYAFHVAIPEGSCVTGFVMGEQVVAIDYRTRRAKHIGQAPPEVLVDVLAVLDAFLY
jgi:mRNA interferase MazF